jgi:hypothetical protein
MRRESRYVEDHPSELLCIYRRWASLPHKPGWVGSPAIRAASISVCSGGIKSRGKDSRSYRTDVVRNPGWQSDGRICHVADLG